MESVDQKFGKITFETRELTVGPYKWEAVIHQRDCSWLGDTEAEAIGNMLNGVAQLAAKGSIDPDHPEEPGPINDGPVQMCVELLERKLSHLVAESADAADKASAAPGGDRVDAADLEERRRLQEARRTIGNIGTALAALCRIESN